MQSLRRDQMVSQPSRLAVALFGLAVALVQAHPPRELCAMIGNVAQWVADCARVSFTEAPQDGAAWLAGDCTRRLTRGGSWHSNCMHSRVFARRSQPTTVVTTPASAWCKRCSERLVLGAMTAPRTRGRRRTEPC